MSNAAVAPELTPTPAFLLVDEHRDSRALLARTMLRKFPSATIEESDSAEQVVETLARFRPAAVIVHRTYNVSGVDLIRMLRASHPQLPIVMVSGIDQSVAAIAAGADRFVHYDEWLLLGNVVEELLRSKAGLKPDEQNPPPQPVG